MPRAQLWCIDITGFPTIVARRIFSIDYEPKQNFDDFVVTLIEGLRHDKRNEDIVLDIWKLNPSIPRKGARFTKNKLTTYGDLKKHVIILSPDSGNLGEIYLDLPEDGCFHLLVALRGSPLVEGPLCSEFLDVGFEENRQQQMDNPIPIAILHPAFDRFLLHMNGPELDLPSEMYPLAMKFASTSWQALGSKSKNMDQMKKKEMMLDVMETMLGCRLIKRTREGAAFDGLLLIEGVYPALIVRNEDDVGGHLMGRCEKTYSKCIRLASLDDLRKNTSLPCFLLVISGSHVSVMGAACPNIDSRPTLESLTGFYVCTSMASDPGEVFTNVAKIFTSLRQALHVLFEYYKDLPKLNNHLPEQHFPLRNTFLTPGGAIAKIKYEGLYSMEKNVWKAALETRDSSSLTSVPVLVKFTRHYSATSHRILESSGLAPKLYYCDLEQNPDSKEGKAGLFFWRMVVMEDFFATAVTLYDLATTRKPPEADARQITEQLRRAVGLLHSEDYVFGDLRSMNVMIKHDILEAGGGQGGRLGSEEKKLRVWLVNFDWAGKVGKARYPSGVSFENIPWPKGVVPKGLITKDHDLYWLRIWEELSS